MLAAIDRARSVSLSAYILPRSVTAHLVAAARRGSDVALALAEYPVGDTPKERWHLAQGNRDAVAMVQRAGGRAELISPRDPLHMKAVLVDDAIAYLDDRNWSDHGPQTILCDDEAADVAVVRDALARHPAGDARMETVKPRSLALETSVIDAAGDQVLEIESESFGIGPVYDALERRAGAGKPTRLLVCDRELNEARAKPVKAGKAPPTEIRALDRLLTDGVDVRVTPAGEKMAVAADRAWIGSTNATRDWGSTSRQLDWGMIVRDADKVAALHRRFTHTWNAATPYERPAPV